MCALATHAVHSSTRQFRSCLAVSCWRVCHDRQRLRSTSDITLHLHDLIVFDTCASAAREPICVCGVNAWCCAHFERGHAHKQKAQTSVLPPFSCTAKSIETVTACSSHSKHSLMMLIRANLLTRPRHKDRRGSPHLTHSRFCKRTQQ